MEDTVATTDREQKQDEPVSSTHDCFLCLLDPTHRCAVPQLQGRIVAAYERTVNGKPLPFITLQAHHARVSLLLTEYYRTFVKDLSARGDAMTALTLRVYHLPEQPQIIERNGVEIHRYTASPYTLAVLEPDVLLNITDLAQAHYCSRQYLLNHLVPSPSSVAMIRGNLVHYCFKELLKEHDRGRTRGRNEHNSLAAPLAVLKQYLEQGLQHYKIELALAHVTPEEMAADVAPHLESLAVWYQHQSATLWDMPAAYSDGTEERSETQGERNEVRAETFLLAPEIGLRGRLDLFWQQAGRQRLLELKTGGNGTGGTLPRPDHRRQVQGYHAQLLVRRNSTMKKALATLVYSGTPGEAEAYGINFTLRELQRVNETRNILVLSHTTGIPPAPPGPGRCTKCSMRAHCERISFLLDWTAPQPDVQEIPDKQREQQSSSSSYAGDIAEEREFFARYYRLLQIEGKEAERQLALLWKEGVDQRRRRGVIIDRLTPLEIRQTEQGEWWQTFACDNTSELRKGDEVLLSDGDPITGQVVTGTIVEISAERVTVWTSELISSPTLIDRYDNDIVHVRTLQNLVRWLEQADPHLRDLVAGRVRPRFFRVDVPPRADFNVEQNLAIARALQMQDYLLIQGPPGTGKTSVIAEIIKRLVQQGQRVLLAAFTNQAVDNVLKRLSEKEQFHQYIRLGHERNIDDTGPLSQHLLQHLVKALPVDGEQTVYDVLSQASVIASTTATWSSDKYSPMAQNDMSASAFHFDVAIIDEASQLTIPALLGALRFAKRFILVGDDKQLPPLVLSKEAAQQGLAESLFSFLKRLDEDYRSKHEMTVGACVTLTTQYRMNRWISNFSSKVFYDGQLIAHEAVAHRQLKLLPPSPRAADSYPPVITRAIDPTRPLVFLDVRDAEGREQAKTSAAEARVVRSLIAAMLQHGIREEEIGVIAPYRAQVATIRHQLFAPAPEHHWPGLKSDSPLTVDTVDRFQGGERLVIIMSFATTSAPEAGSQQWEFLTNANRLNVALTRAQRKLVLVGCVPALEHLPIFHRLFTYCRSMGTVFSTTQE